MTLAEETGEDNKATRMVRGISRVCVAATLAAALFFLFAHWAVNAEGLGARDLGLAAFFSFTSAFAFVLTLWSVPFLLLAGGLTWRFHAPAARGFLLAGAFACIPFSVRTWLA